MFWLRSFSNRFINSTVEVELRPSRTKSVLVIIQSVISLSLRPARLMVCFPNGNRAVHFNDCKGRRFYSRIPEISNAKNHRHVIENLKRTRGLQRIHLCGRIVYLTDAVKAWLENHITCGQ